MKLYDGYEFWQNLSKELDRRGLNNMELAEKAGLPYRTITTQRNRHTIPGAEQLYRMANALDVTMEYLLTGTSNRITSNEALAIQENQGIKKIVDFLIKNPEVIEKIIMLFDIDIAKSTADRLA